MALVIEDRETERLVEELARRTGRTPERFVEDAVAALASQTVERPQSGRSEEGKAAARAKIREIQRRVAALPDGDTRTADEIIGYDEHGVPR